jgi:hypothetical protein
VIGTYVHVSVKFVFAFNAGGDAVPQHFRRALCVMRVLGFTPLPLEECVAAAVDLRCNKRLVAYTTPHRNGRAAAER